MQSGTVTVTVRLQVDAVQHQLSCGMASGMLHPQDGSAADGGGYYPQVATVDSFQVRFPAALSVLCTTKQREKHCAHKEIVTKTT